jgi:hypothetical protein
MASEEEKKQVALANFRKKLLEHKEVSTKVRASKIASNALLNELSLVLL